MSPDFIFSYKKLDRSLILKFYQTSIVVNLIIIEQVYTCVCLLCYSFYRLCISDTCRSLSTTTRSGRLSFIFRNSPLSLSMNNQICSHYVHLSATLCDQLHTTVDNVKRLFFECSNYRNSREGVVRRYITVSNTSPFREMLSGSTKYQGVDGYFHVCAYTSWHLGKS